MMNYRGLQIEIENPAGSVRSGISYVTGEQWSTKLTHDYGEIIGSRGMDGDPIDVFIGPSKNAPFVYVVHQLQQHTGGFDEDKCFLGFDDVMDAKAAYYKNYDYPDRFFGSIETIPFAEFKKKVLSTKGDTMIHARKDVTVGDPVTVNGLRGRGVVVADDGSDVVVKYLNGEYFKRKKYNVTHMGDNYYHSRYSSVKAAGQKCPRCGSSKFSLMPTDFETAKCKKCGKTWNHGIQAGGPGSGRHKDAMKEYQRIYQLAKQAGHNDDKAHKLATDAYVNKFQRVYAGGPGSGRKPGYGKGLNKWKSPEEERKAAAKDPKQMKLPLKAGLEPVEMERGPITVPHGTNKRIEKVGTNFCVVSDGVDKNFGCYGDRKQAESVLSGQSFIMPDIPDNLYASLMRPGMIRKMPKPHMGRLGNRLPNKSRPHGVGVGHHLPNPSRLAAFGDFGEPMAGSMAHAHIEPEFWFHPPSLEKRGRADHVPTDDPGEKDNKFLDVTKRKQAHKDRMKILKRGAPGGLPPYIPAVTTGLAPHQSSFAPTIAGAGVPFQKKRKGNQGGELLDIVPRNLSLRVPHQVAYTKGVRAGRTKDRRMRKAFNAAAI